MTDTLKHKGGVFWSLLLIQLANWRWSWQATVINGLVIPITAMFFLRAATGDASATNATFLICGNIVVSLIFAIMFGTSARFAFMRQFGVLDYYATLPVPKVFLVMAVNTGFLILTLPTALLTIFLGEWYLNVSLDLNPLFFLLVPLASFSLSAVGAFVGVLSPNFDTANTITAVLQFIFMGFGPILVPLNRLPGFMQFISNFLPSTYAADALRRSLTKQIDGQFLFDVGLLLLFDIAAMVFVGTKMEWRRG